MDLRDILSLRALSWRQVRELRLAMKRAEPWFESILEDDPDGLRLAERPLADLPASNRIADATSQDVIAIAIASAGHLRRLPLNDTFRSVSLKEPAAYRIHFAAIRVLELSAEAGLPFSVDQTKLLCEIAVNAQKFEDVADTRIEHSASWPDYAAQMITGRLLAPERLDLFDAAIAAAEVLDGGLYDGVLAAQIVRMGQRLDRVPNPSYEIGEMRKRIDGVLAKPTSLLRPELR